MKQVIYGNDGTPESMQLAEGNVPRPGPGEILIEVAFAGINRPDVLQRSGRYPLVLMYDPERKHPATGLFAEPEIERPPEPKHTRPVPWVEVPPEPEPVKVEPVKIPVEAITPVKPEPEVVKKKKKK